jgi:hypothetical protein
VATTTTAPPVPVADRPGRTPWLPTAALTLAGAGVLHLAAAADHREESELVVWFFLAVALGQLGGAAWFAVAAATRQRPAAPTVLLAAAATVGLVLLYLAAHTTDLLAALPQPAQEATHPGHSVQPDASAGHPAGWLGSATVTVELVGLLALTALLPPRIRRITVDGVLVLGALAWTLWLLGLLG